MQDVHISAKVDYGLRALCTLASSDEALTADQLAEAQGLPVRFLRAILNELRRGGIVISHRGNEGGYQLSGPASAITIGDVFRKLEGPLAEVRGLRPEAASYQAAAENLQTIWVALRACIRDVLDEITIADTVSGRLPKHVRALVDKPDAWQPR
jgi:Rrf2 family protein